MAPVLDAHYQCKNGRKISAVIIHLASQARLAMKSSGEPRCCCVYCMAMGLAEQT